MPTEVELKARVSDPASARARLSEFDPGETSTYRDTYYDWPDHRLENTGRQELRLRVVETASATRCVWTYKGTMLDEASTPEYETTVGDADAAHAILTGLGLQPVISFTKQCENFRFHHDGLPILATLVQVPELDGTFLEVETVVPDGVEVTTARRAVDAVLASIGLAQQDLEPTLYIDLVRRARNLDS